MKQRGVRTSEQSKNSMTAESARFARNACPPPDAAYLTAKETVTEIRMLIMTEKHLKLKEIYL